ncbi:MAG: hypothetical protein IPM98_15185 [Lewinellaceae bacterium]|nr:hypothetical protein [Lewinellaceae bacterium]
MLHSDLVEDLRIFSGNERHRLFLFLKSPYFIGKKEVEAEINLIQCIFQALSDTEVPVQIGLERERVFQVLFPGSPYNTRSLTKIANSALELVRAFIEAEMLHRRSLRPVGPYARLVDFFTERGAIEAATRYLKRMERVQETNNSKDVFELSDDWEAGNSKSKLMTVYSDIKDDVNLLATLQALETFYWIQRLDLLVPLFNLRNFKTILSDAEVDAILKEIDLEATAPWYSSPLGQLYRVTLKFLCDAGADGEVAFDTFMEIFSKYKAQIPEYHLKRFEQLAYNFCVRKFQIPKYREVLFDLYRSRYQSSSQAEEASIPASEFLSIFKTAIIQQQFEFARSFADMLRHKIAGIQPSEDYYQLSMALYLFAKREFDEARVIVTTLNFHDIAYRYLAKLLEIELLYEGGEPDYGLLENRLHAFRIMIGRETSLTGERVRCYDNFYKFTTRLDRLRKSTKKIKTRLQELHDEIEAVVDIYERKWLKKKIEELSGRE